MHVRLYVYMCACFVPWHVAFVCVIGVIDVICTVRWGRDRVHCVAPQRPMSRFDGGACVLSNGVSRDVTCGHA